MKYPFVDRNSERLSVAYIIYKLYNLQKAALNGLLSQIFWLEVKVSFHCYPTAYNLVHILCFADSETEALRNRF